jgi:hypothetical protein
MNNRKVARYGTRTAAAMVSVMALLMSLSSPLAASPEGVTRRDSDVTTFEPPPLLDETTRVIQGSRISVPLQTGNVATGCRYTVEISVPPGVPSLAQHETREDQSTCTMTIVEGVPLDGSDSVPTTSVDGRSVGGSGGPTGEAALLAPTQDSLGVYRAWVEDPPPLRLVVARARSYVGWSWGGGGWAFFNPRNPNPDGGDPACHASTDALHDTGWNRTAFDVNCNRDDSNPVYVETATLAHWKNGIFCLTIDTDVDFNRARARGHRNGNLTGITTVDIYGGCSGLLSFHQSVERLIN